MKTKSTNKKEGFVKYSNGKIRWYQDCPHSEGIRCLWVNEHCGECKRFLDIVDEVKGRYENRTHQ